jgi:hypothetical protein
VALRRVGLIRGNAVHEADSILGDHGVRHRRAYSLRNAASERGEATVIVQTCQAVPDSYPRSSTPPEEI